MLPGSSVRAAAKFFYEGAEKFWVRGVTYGTFEPRGGENYPLPARVTEDFALMREAGVNTVRIYTAPPRYLLDEAARQGLRVIIGLAWSQHLCFLDDRRQVAEIRRQVRREVRACADHAAVLAFAIGNEIPAPIVRWHGARKIEQFLRQLYDEVKCEAPRSLVTYVNYPPTDYLDLPFLDFVCFNVFLHQQADFRDYLAKLHNLAGNRPLVLSELGLDSIGHGEREQANFLDSQLRAAYAGGAAGACIFSWTDDWHRGGQRISDWAFGLVDAERQPKPAYEAVKSRFARIPFEAEAQEMWPKVSVVICAYNAQSTIEDNLESLARLNYPNYEVIVIDDGSKDATPRIAARYPWRLISVENGGLSAARNLGWQAASGEIVAYTDADTRVDPEWLSYLVQPFLTSDAVGVGGPNVVPGDDGWIAQCVARSPGGPTHVLLNDRLAEHIPGCNMAFRRRALEEVGGFNPIYTKAGDDVDICWRLQSRGWQLAFSPAALVWHHHRNSVRAYWRQQVGYGEGERFLERRHREKFNDRGQTRWQGRIYSHLPAYRSLFKSVIYYGRWGASAFPSVYQGAVRSWRCLPQMIEWQALTLLILVVAIFSPWTMALLVAAGLMLGSTLGVCLAHAWMTKIDDLPAADSPFGRLKHRLLIAWLHYIQPLARSSGRIKGYFRDRQPVEDGGLLKNAPRLSPGDSLRLLFHRLEASYWDTRYTSTGDFLRSLERVAGAALAPVNCDHGWQQQYDLQVRAGHTISFKIKLAAEDHGGLKRLFRLRFMLKERLRLWAVIAATGMLAGCLSRLFLFSWYRPAALAILLALTLVLSEVSRRGGQLLAAAELVGQELKLYSLLKTTPAEGDKNEPAFGE